ncbi:hypothetical protein X777_13437 [Ooceraea biroi]|uniref:Uncharacterized protein n=1 Tax=Ooceraea biroi TaxID=2015173 RepID=A0A026WWY3_OOCBI|nr:hypothetical protein X777_13437 [Ooceraea biroi]
MYPGMHSIEERPASQPRKWLHHGNSYVRYFTGTNLMILKMKTPYAKCKRRENVIVVGMKLRN